MYKDLGGSKISITSLSLLKVITVSDKRLRPDRISPDD